MEIHQRKAALIILIANKSRLGSKVYEIFIQNDFNQEFTTTLIFMHVIIVIFNPYFQNTFGRLDRTEKKNR